MCECECVWLCLVVCVVVFVYVIVCVVVCVCAFVFVGVCVCFLVCACACVRGFSCVFVGGWLVVCVGVACMGVLDVVCLRSHSYLYRVPFITRSSHVPSGQRGEGVRPDHLRHTVLAEVQVAQRRLPGG